MLRHVCDLFRRSDSSHMRICELKVAYVILLIFLAVLVKTVVSGLGDCDISVPAVQS